MGGATMRLKRLASIKLADFVSKYTVHKSVTPTCAICGKAERKRLARDHCHATGLRRGDLCSRCNMGIGLFEDSPDLLASAARYLIHYGKKVA